MLRLALLLSLALGGPALAAPAAHFTVRADAPQHHYFQVEARYPSRGKPLTLFMPVWTPGSYLVREHARHVELVSATSAAGKPLPVEKVTKNRWRVTPSGKGPVAVRYRVYAFDLTVRTNYLDAEFGLSNGPALFLLPTKAKDSAQYDVSFVPPGDWSVHTALPKHPKATGPHHYRADRDTLIDSPVLWGKPTVGRFTVAGVPHELLTVGAPADVFDPERAAKDLKALVETQAKFWGGLPKGMDQYLFLNILADSGGGLEHKASTVVMGARQVMRDAKHYRGWLRLASHEYFHTWNVKRLRPKALGPFDYERENHTRSLWVAEGITSYFDGLLWRRAGLAEDKHLLERMSKNIKRVQTTPGRAVRSLALASYDAWIRFYRHDENSLNADVSYYTKGALVAFLLDAQIQRLTKGKRTLDDVMRAAYRRFSGKKGFTPAQFEALASETTGHDLRAFFDRNVRGTGELDYGPALAWFGLRFKPAKDEAGPGWLGLRHHVVDNRLRVKEVPVGTPAHAAGVAAGDELLAIDGYRIPKKGWDAARARRKPGEQAALLVARRGVVRSLAVQFAAAPADTWALERDPKATAAQKARFDQWVSGSAAK